MADLSEKTALVANICERKDSCSIVETDHKQTDRCSALQHATVFILILNRAHTEADVIAPPASQLQTSVVPLVI